jgi:excisionase family DNA binding protein
MGQDAQQLTYTPAQVARLLGLSEPAIRARIFLGQLPVVRWGRRVLIRHNDLMKGWTDHGAACDLQYRDVRPRLPMRGWSLFPLPTGQKIPDRPWKQFQSSRPSAHAELTAINQARCVPPLSSSEVAQIAHSASRYPPG